MNKETKQFIVSCIEQHRGDDFYRAGLEFRDCTPKEMSQPYGQSGQTRQQILDSYKEHERQCNEAVTELEMLFLKVEK